MRTLGYCLLIFGFLWVEYVPLSVDPLIRAMDTAYRQHHQVTTGQEAYTSKDLLSAFVAGAQDFARFARLSGIGGLVMLAGGIILGREAKRNSIANEPPVLPPQ
jgi:hypothetical protein